ncbi:MAG: mechanosensitive ion channel [Bacteroidaceae bacterium]|nr:mechanosensitive ion channel [Bacteroidaceae bacterium]
MEEQNLVSDLSNIDLSNIDLHLVVNYLITLGKNIITAIIVFFVGRFLIKYIVKALRAVTQKHQFEASLVSFINSLISISLNLLLAIIIIGILGIDTTSFLAVFASAGMAVGMALSGTLQNFAGGVLILALKPYKVGDYIEAQGFGGTVKAIQIFNTVLTTPDNQTIIIPNGPLATGSLKNSTSSPTRRIDIDVEVAYGTDPDEVRKVLKDIVDADSRIMKEGALAPIMPMTTMSSSSIIFQMRLWTKASDYWSVRFETIEKVYKELTESGIEIPFPQMDVHLKND